MSETQATNEIAAALAKAQLAMQTAKKDKTNPHFKSKYADLASVVEACRVLAENGIAHTQLPSTSGDLKTVTVTTMLLHTSGQSLSSVLTFPVAQATPQAFGSALTYLRRYALSAMAGVAPEEDDDANEASKQAAPVLSVAPAPMPPKAPQGDLSAKLIESGIAAAKTVGELAKWIDACKQLPENERKPVRETYNQRLETLKRASPSAGQTQ